LGGYDRVYNQGYFKRFPSNSPRGYAVEMVVMVGDIERYYLEVKQFANIVKPLVDRPWG
jgi:hypothetical protein